MSDWVELALDLGEEVRWMICKSIRLVYDTRKLQKYVKMQGN